MTSEGIGAGNPGTPVPHPPHTRPFPARVPVEGRAEIHNEDEAPGTNTLVMTKPGNHVKPIEDQIPGTNTNIKPKPGTSDINQGGSKKRKRREEVVTKPKPTHTQTGDVKKLTRK